MIRVVDEELRGELRRRAEIDQEIRRVLDGPEGLSPEHVRRMVAIDADNAAWLREVIAEHGWPGRRLVGPDGAADAWLLAQHADGDPALQAECLSALREAARRGDATPPQVAYLTDRVRCARGEAQIYGTQFWYGPDGRGDLQPKPIADPEHLDSRRAAAGLEPFAEYLDSLRRHHP